MNRKRISLCLCLLAGIVILVAACQPTPQSEVIVNKGDGQLEEILQQAPAPPGRYSAPSHWSETATRQMFTIEIDADVTLPDMNEYPVVLLEPAAFTQQQVDELVGYFAQGKKLYKSHVMTKADYEEQIVEAKRGQMADGEYVVTDESRAWVAELERRQQAAPADSPIIYTDTTLTYNRDDVTGDDSLAGGKNFLSVMVENGDGNDASIRLNNYVAGYREFTSFSYSNHPDIGYITESTYRMSTESAAEEDMGMDGVAELFDKVVLTQKEAEEKAQQVLSDLGIGDMVLDIAEKAVSSGAPDKGGYQLRYVRESGGIPLYMSPGGGWAEGEAPPAYSPPFSEEFFIALVTEDGLIDLYWRGSAKVAEVVSSNVPMLPFDTIQQALKDQIFYKQSFGARSNKVIVISAELRMGYIGVKDNVNQAMMVPVWVFETDISMYNKLLGKEQRYRDYDYVFNAIDAGVIEIERMEIEMCC